MAIDFGRALGQGLNLRQGFDQQRQGRKLEDLRGQLDFSQPLQSQGAFQQLAAINPTAATQLRGALRTDEQGFDAAFQDAAVFKNIFQNDPQRGIEFLQGRIQSGKQQGRDMFLSEGLLNTALSNPQEAISEVDSFLSIPQQLAGQRGQTDTRTANVRDFDKFQELLSTAKQTDSTEDKEKARQFGLKAGFFKSTEQETADIKISAAEKRAIAKANVARKQGFINSGVEAADGVASIKKSLVLLRDIKTGGFDNFKLRASQFFGVEGADAAELSANLGKNVLGQLKNIFGSAFTEKEGARLERIEAGFGKSTAGNIRLLENALKIADRSARRGIAAAEDQGADFTAGEIRDALKFDFSLPDQPVDDQAQTSGGQTFNFDAQGNPI